MTTGDELRKEYPIKLSEGYDKPAARVVFSDRAFSDYKKDTKELSVSREKEMSADLSEKIEKVEAHSMAKLLSNPDVKKLIDDLGLELISCGVEAAKAENANGEKVKMPLMMQEFKNKISR